MFNPVRPVGPSNISGMLAPAPQGPPRMAQGGGIYNVGAPQVAVVGPARPAPPMAGSFGGLGALGGRFMPNSSC